MPINKSFLGSYANRGKIKIKACSDARLWYSKSLGEVYNVCYIDSNEIVVLGPSGYKNIVKKEDCEFV